MTRRQWRFAWRLARILHDDMEARDMWAGWGSIQGEACAFVPMYPAALKALDDRGQIETTETPVAVWRFARAMGFWPPGREVDA